MLSWNEAKFCVVKHDLNGPCEPWLSIIKLSSSWTAKLCRILSSLFYLFCFWPYTNVTQIATMNITCVSPQDDWKNNIYIHQHYINKKRLYWKSLPQTILNSIIELGQYENIIIMFLELKVLPLYKTYFSTYEVIHLFR